MIKFLLILFYISSLYSLPAEKLITGLELAKRMEARLKPNDLKSENTMILTNKKGRKKTSKLISKSKDDSKKQMIWFLEPKDDYGISFLKIEHADEDDYMNMWLPGFNKFRRISSQKKTDSFMGSDLSFEDLSNRDIEDYDYLIIDASTECHDQDIEKKCYILESKPKDKNSEYSKHISWVDKNKLIALKEESFDKDEKLLKTKSINYQQIEEYLIMRELFVKNVQKNHTTLLTIDKISINLNYTEDIFHTKNLKRIPLD